MYNQVYVQNSKKYQFFCSHDLDLDPMTLILKLDLDIIKMYLHTKNEVSSSRHSKVIARTDRQTHRQTHRQTDTQTHRHTHTHTDTTENITTPHTRVVIKRFCSDTCIVTDTVSTQRCLYQSGSIFTMNVNRFWANQV